jgi:hypothetical protein
VIHLQSTAPTRLGINLVYGDGDVETAKYSVVNRRGYPREILLETGWKPEAAPPAERPSSEPGHSKVPTEMYLNRLVAKSMFGLNPAVPKDLDPVS